jgi:hypothetical protein
MSSLTQVGGVDGKVDSIQIKLKLSGIDLGSLINSAFTMKNHSGTFGLNKCTYNKVTGEYTLVVQD